MMQPGRIRLSDSPDDVIYVDRVLLDPGSLHASYMSLVLYKKHERLLSPYKREYTGTVSLGGTGFSTPIYHQVYVPLEMNDPYGLPHLHWVTFSVFDTAIPVILGAPHLMEPFLDYFLLTFPDIAAKYARAPNSKTAPPKDSTSLHHLLDRLEDSAEATFLPVPWNDEVNEEAPEDAHLPYPGDSMNYLPLTKHHLSFPAPTEKDRRTKFLDLLETNVAPSFRQDPQLMECLLKHEKVFVPWNWDGIKGVDPIVMKWTEGVPTVLRPKIRPVNPKLMEAAKLETERLRTYFWVPSDSPVSSPLVIAPKATPPYIRMCGSYVHLNKYVDCPNWPIPDPKRQVERASKFKFFADLDMTNGFHQLRLSEETSRMLSVATPWGQFQPLFLPEGVSPASYYLHQTMVNIFRGHKDKNGIDIEEWLIVIFDNMLVCAMSQLELAHRLDVVLTICGVNNVFLKMIKSFIGFCLAAFFGYEVRFGSYGLKQDRLDALANTPFPTNIKQMQRALGGFLFCADFVPNYGVLAAPLYDLTKVSFDWSQDMTKYQEAFAALKAAVLNTIRLHTPDYDLPWTLRTDASDTGCGAILYQTVTMEDGSSKVQIIATYSHKWSDAATRYSVYDKECTAIYLAVQKLEYFLRAKPFTVETDHANLVWMHLSANPRVIRQKAYLQSFMITQVKHIKGADNDTADMLSRLPSVALEQIVAALVTSAEQDLDPSIPVLDAEDMFHKCHSGRLGHWAAPEVWKRMNKLFPGHNVPYRTIDALVRACPTCQKERLNQRYFLNELIKTHKRTKHKITVGADLLQVTQDKDGYLYIVCVTNFFSKRCRLFKTKDKSAESLARCMLVYITQHGLFDELRSDPGSDFTSELFSWLVKWLGFDHTFTLVNRPQGSNVEGTNSQVMRHLRHLVFDERLEHCWSQEHVLSIVEYIINTHYNREVGGVPLHIDWGDLDLVYSKLPDDIDARSAPAKARAFAESLQSTLTTVREATAVFQQQLDKERRPREGPTNIFQPGDLVRKRNESKPRLHKLQPKWLGPYKVVSHRGNDVTCVSLTRQLTMIFHVSLLELWVGTEEEAFRMAMIDEQQFKIKQITSHTGDPFSRMDMTFQVEYEDGSIEDDRPWDRDFFDTVQYETYCRNNPELTPLLFLHTEALKIRAAYRKSPVQIISPGDTFYVKLQGIPGHDAYQWYQDLDLPHYRTSTYVVQAECLGYCGPKKSPKQAVTIAYPVLGIKRDYYNDWVTYWCTQRHLKDTDILVDDTLVNNNQQLSKYSRRRRPPKPSPPKPTPIKILTKKPTKARKEYIKLTEEEKAQQHLDIWGFPIEGQQLKKQKTLKNAE